ncbi:MAG: phage holin family protein [Halanaerobacter sp.]
MKMLIKFGIMVLALVLTAKIIPGIMISSLGAGIWAALILGAVNTFLKPMLTIFTLPLTILTLGLFSLILNGLLFLLAANLVTGFYVSGIGSATFGAVSLSFINGLMSGIIDED